MSLGYKIALGWDQAEGDMDPIAPQPHSEGVKYQRRTFTAANTIVEENSYVELEWNIIGSIYAYQQLLSQFGLYSAYTSYVTIRVPEYQFAFNRFNGIAIRPEHGKEVRQRDHFIRDLVILVQLKGYGA